MFFVRLTQIEDYYTTHDTLEFPMDQLEFIKVLAQSIQLHGFPPIIVIVKMFEFEDGSIVYCPLKQFDLLIQATKMAYANHPDLATISIPVVLEESDNVKSYETFMKITNIVNRGQVAVNLFTQKINSLQKESARLMSFAELVNNATIDNEI